MSITPDLPQSPPEPMPVECQQCNKLVYYFMSSQAIEAWGAWFCNRVCADLYYAEQMDNNQKNGQWLSDEYVENVMGR